MVTTINDIKILIKLANDNNHFGLVESMLQEKIPYKRGQNIQLTMLNIYRRDKGKFYRIMRRVKYNKRANNYTTSMNFHRKIKPILMSLKANSSRPHNRALKGVPTRMKVVRIKKA